MFIYIGKFDFDGANVAENDIFVLALPKGPVSEEDPVWLFQQYTGVGSSGSEKGQRCEHAVIRNVSKGNDGDDTFSCTMNITRMKIQSQQGYSKVAVTMSNPPTWKEAESTTVLDRIYQSSGDEIPGTARVWHGHMIWTPYADREACIIIVPEGFGEGKPALVAWQWTVDSSGTPKALSIINSTQQTSDDAPDKFTLASTDYNISCTWNQANGKLTLRMQEHQGEWRDVGLFHLISTFTPDKLPPEEMARRLEIGLAAMKEDRDKQKKALEECRKQIGPVWQPATAPHLYQGLDTPPPPLLASIRKHQSKTSWARMSTWIGSMSNTGTFFNSLDDIDQTCRLLDFSIWSRGPWITGFKLAWTNGKTQSYGVTDGSSASQSYGLKNASKIVAATVLTDKVPGSFQPVNAFHLYTFDPTHGYSELGGYAAPHTSWTAPRLQTSFAPALQGSWSLCGVYGYYDVSSLDALGFVWVKDQ